MKKQFKFLSFICLSMLLIVLFNIKVGLNLNDSVAVGEEFNDIKFSDSNLDLDIGKEELLIMTNIPDDFDYDDFIWVTYNAKVATVDDGLVKAVGVGETKILVIYKKDHRIEGECVVKVSKADVNNDVKAQKIEFSNSDLTVKKGSSGKINYRVLPSNASDSSINWKSSNSGVVTVSNEGVVTAVGDGTATITASLVSDPNIKATCNITVKSVEVKVSDIVLDKANIDLNVGEKYSINAKVNSGSTVATLKYKSSNTKVVKVASDGTVKAVGVGSASVMVASGSINTTCTINVTSKNAEMFLKTLDNISDQVENQVKSGKKWKYQWKGHSGSFATAVKKGNRKLTCIVLPSWALIEMDILKSGQIFGNQKNSKGKTYTWYNGNSDTKNRLKKYFKFINANGKKAYELVKTGDLQPGDIVLWKKYHTSVYAGDKKWYDAGRNGKNGATKSHPYFKTFGPIEIPDAYNKDGIRQIVRFKI